MTSLQGTMLAMPGVSVQESILVKYCDEILPLITHFMKGRVKILETCPKAEEIINLYPILLCICILLCYYIEQNCHGFVTTLSNLKLACHHI